jgi:nitroimidazol reductase NimA-like FMN-containing flavoprotein (pyridoxamine 5'-phosphate oxidase superfamily)
MQTEKTTQTILTELFAVQRFAVLATSQQDTPHACLMAVAATENLHHLIITTKRDTRKFAQIAANPNVAFLIDNRTNAADDVREAIAVTVRGRAEEMQGERRERLLHHYLARHPYMVAFATSPDCALLLVWVERYQVVIGLDDVRLWTPG